MTEVETYITEDGLIDVLTMPRPQSHWVWELCFDRGVGRFTFAGSYEVTLDELAGILIHGDFPGVLREQH